MGVSCSDLDVDPPGGVCKLTRCALRVLQSTASSTVTSVCWVSDASQELGKVVYQSVSLSAGGDRELAHWSKHNVSAFSMCTVVI